MARIKTPTVLQMEAIECGAASLGVILAYFGKYVPLEELREECGVSRDGSKAINILKAARKYGLTAQAAKAEVDDLKSMDIPVIIFWKFNHFLVVEGFSKDKVYINDPATGPRSVSHEEFDKSFTGIVFLMEPKSGFKKEGKPPSAIAALKKRLHGSKNALNYAVLVSLFLVIPGIIIPGFSKIFIDNILVLGMRKWILPLLTSMVVIALLQSLLTYLQNHFLLRLRIKMLLSSSSRFVWHMMKLPMSFFENRFAGDINQRIGANDRVADLLSSELTASAVGLISMVFYAFVMLLLSWPLAIIGIVVALANFVLLTMISRKIADISRRFLQDQGKLGAIQMNGLQLIESIKASATEDDFFKRWSGQHAKTINSQQSIALFNQVLLIVPRLLNGLTVVAVLGLGSWLVMQGSLTLGALVAFQSLLMSFNGPLSTLLGLGNNIQKIRGDLARMDDVLKYPEDVRLSQGAKAEKTGKRVKGSLQLNNIRFGYSRLDPPLLDDFNLQVKESESIAVIGRTGCGKSTIAKLICGLYQPWQGEVMYDGKSISHYSSNQLAKSLSYVDQDIFLFEGTVRDNLTLWHKDVDEAALEKAVHDACLQDVLEERSGLNTWVAENGLNFSGGQRQRLEIARALVANPSLLILDEATASLDADLEAEIFSNLYNRHYTLLLITHRLAPIKLCDQIVLLEQGRIVVTGAHDQLLADKNSSYLQFLALES